MISRNNFLAGALGIITGVVILLLVLALSAFSSNSNTPELVDQSASVTYLSLETQDTLSDDILTLFGLTRKESLQANETSDLLSEDITVRIIAQARIGAAQNTMLEISSKTETKRIRVKEGSIVNGLEIKAITDKQLIVEKDGSEHSIKLFHPKELNSTKIEQNQ